jgi:hypothetical protein
MVWFIAAKERSFEYCLDAFYPLLKLNNKESIINSVFTLMLFGGVWKYVNVGSNFITEFSVLSSCTVRHWATVTQHCSRYLFECDRAR